MKKTVDILLVLALLGASAYVVFLGLGSGVSAGSSTPTESSVPGDTPTWTETYAPTVVPTLTLIPASVTIPTLTPSSTLPPTSTSTPSPTATETPTSTPTPTSDPTQSPVDSEMAAGVKQGNQIIQALEAYHAAQGEYPLTLDALIPAYLSGIPKTITGQHFFYRPFEATSLMASEVYWLAFKVVRQDHLNCTYLRRLDYWDCNDESP